MNRLRWITARSYRPHHLTLIGRINIIVNNYDPKPTIPNTLRPRHRRHRHLTRMPPITLPNGYNSNVSAPHETDTPNIGYPLPLKVQPQIGAAQLTTNRETERRP